MTPRPRVLIADDDPAICRLIERILPAEAYETISTNDAESALLALEGERHFDLVICDFMLPGISGRDLIERLRARKETQGMPVVMISGHTREPWGADIFLDKPFSISQLRAAVSSLV